MRMGKIDADLKIGFPEFVSVLRLKLINLFVGHLVANIEISYT